MFGLFVALTIFAFVSGSYFSEEISSKKESITSEVKSEKTENTSIKSDNSEAKVTVNVESDSNSSTDQKSNANVEEFKYPGSSVVSSDSNKLSLTSSDSADKITDWYKSKIKDKKLSATSFVTTSTNGKVLNKLAADGAFHIEVEIQKEANSSTKIEVVTSK